MSLSFDASRFNNASALVSDRLASLEGSGDFGVEDILSAASGDLSIIPSEHLRTEKELGRGTSFRVTKDVYDKPDSGVSPYYVAVKRFVPSTRHNGHQHASGRLYSGLLRELRVILHPPLRSHGCVMQALAHGWYQDPIIGLQPYLVLEYSDYGSLADYLRRSKISLVERRELALDTASALNALHSCHIIHGDIKPENVLIYDNDDVESYLDNHEVRSQIARLADFGAAVFEQDFILQREVTYLGTSRYLSPEFAGRPGVSRANESPTFDLYKSADVYSLGLVIWEIIKDGQKYIDSTQLSPGQNWEDYLDHLCALKSDELLSTALSFCTTLPELEQNPVIHQALTKTLAMCLKDEPSQRGRMDAIIPVLADGTRVTRPRYTTSRSRFLPLSEPLEDSDSSVTTLVPARKSEGGFVKRIQFNATGNLKVRAVEEGQSMPHGMTTDVGGLFLMKPSKASALENRGQDIFKMVMAVGQPPWAAQCQLASRMRTIAMHSSDNTKKAHAHLQLAVMYHLGYGVEPDTSMAMIQLEASNSARPLTKEFYDPVLEALQSLTKLDDRRSSLGSGRQEKARHRSYLPLRPRESGIPKSDFDFTPARLDPVTGLRVEEPLKTNAGTTTTHFSLTTACRNGNFDRAKELAEKSIQLEGDSDSPNFLHWLIMFQSNQARELLEISFANEFKANSSKILLDQDSGPALYFTNLSLELFGSPLHWAVRTGNIDLVALFIDYGADINKVWEGHEVRQGEMRLSSGDAPVGSIQFILTPLEIAVTHHFSDIADLLLRKGSIKFRSEKHQTWHHSCFHMVGLPVLPFSRFTSHGDLYREAARETIRVLEAHELDINVTDNFGKTPLTLAAQFTDVEPYVLEEMIQAGAGTSRQFDAAEGSIMTSCAKYGVDRPLDTRRVNLFLPLVKDLNILDNTDDGRSALHWCALFDVSGVARALLNTGRVRVDQLSRRGHTPLIDGAFRGMVSTIECLVQAGADLELRSRQDLTALQVAVSSRHLQTAVKLIQLGSQVETGQSNILHLAVTNGSQRGSIARELLAQCSEKLKVARILNGFEKDGWTPLHRAAYFGDLDGVEALLHAGADPLAFRLPPEFLYGGNPLELVSKLSTRFQTDGLGKDHARVSEKGQAAVKEFLRRISAIQRILSEWVDGMQ